MEKDSSVFLMTIFHGFHNHKTIFWDTHDSGETLTLSVIDREEPEKSIKDVLCMTAYELTVFIEELTLLRNDMRKPGTANG